MAGCKAAKCWTAWGWQITPGPLIQVVQFVGFMGAYRMSGTMDPLVAGILASRLLPGSPLYLLPVHFHRGTVYRIPQGQ